MKTPERQYVDEALEWLKRWKLHAPAGAVEDLARMLERAESNDRCGGILEVA